MKKLQYFGASWCAGCRIVKPVIEKLEGVEVDIVDLDTDAGTDKAFSLGIRNIPALIILDENGEQIQRFIGKEEILSYLK